MVEKTCANSLRVGFVNRVVPEARFLFIRRDGIDAAASAMERWHAHPDPVYLARKARFVPLTDWPHYAWKIARGRVRGLLGGARNPKPWGPRLDGMDALLAQRPLEEVCALQWKRCVDSAADAFAKMPADRWLEVVYEDFVRAPEEELGRVLELIGVETDADSRQAAVAGVREDSVGRGRGSWTKARSGECRA